MTINVKILELIADLNQHFLKMKTSTNEYIFGNNPDNLEEQMPRTIMFEELFDRDENIETVIDKVLADIVTLELYSLNKEKKEKLSYWICLNHESKDSPFYGDISSTEFPHLREKGTLETRINDFLSKTFIDLLKQDKQVVDIITNSYENFVENKKVSTLKI